MTRIAKSSILFALFLIISHHTDVVECRLGTTASSGDDNNLVPEEDDIRNLADMDCRAITIKSECNSQKAFCRWKSSKKDSGPLCSYKRRDKNARPSLPMGQSACSQLVRKTSCKKAGCKWDVYSSTKPVCLAKPARVETRASVSDEKPSKANGPSASSQATECTIFTNRSICTKHGGCTWVQETKKCAEADLTTPNLVPGKPKPDEEKPKPEKPKPEKPKPEPEEPKPVCPEDAIYFGKTKEDCASITQDCKEGALPWNIEGCGCGCTLNDSAATGTSPIINCTYLWEDELYISTSKNDTKCSTMRFMCHDGYHPVFPEGCGCGCMLTETKPEDPDVLPSPGSPLPQPGPGSPLPQPGPEPSTGTTPSPDCPKSTGICMTLWEPKKCTNPNVADPQDCFYSNLCLATSVGYSNKDCVSSGTMDVSVRTISEETINPVDEKEVTSQVEAALILLADSTITRELQQLSRETDPILMDSDAIMMPAMDQPVMAMTVESAAAPADVTDSVNEYDTNTQEENVDEADGAKSDGTYIYAAYGDVIKVWDKSGDDLTEYPLPPTDSGSATDTSTTSTTSGFAEPMIIMDYYPICVKPMVQSLMLTENHLVAFVSGYKNMVLQEKNIDGQTILSGYGQTRVMVFDKTNVATEGLQLEAHRDVHGSFRSARKVGETIHTVTVSYIQTYHDLLYHLQRNSYPLYKGMNETAYEEAAANYALKDVIPDFTSKLMSEICGDGFDCPDQFLPLVMWQDKLSGGDDAMLWENGIMDSYVAISSLNMANFDDLLIETGDSEPHNTFNLSITASFFPTGGVTTYASEDVMALAGQGYHFDATRNVQLQQTYLLGFQLNNEKGTTTPYAYGSLPGYVLDQFSLDHEDGHLRVATTIRNWWRVPLEDSSTVLTQETPRMTENYVSVLKLNGTRWDIVGQTPSLGKEGETIHAIRYFRKVAYVVTFRQTDPFYVIDLSDPTVEKIPVLGELSITGFSQYLHPLNEDETILLALGQDADDTGRTLGVSLTIFNATDPTEPTYLDKFVVENRTDAYSSSSAQWDHRAFRYFGVPGLEDADGYLILPMNMYDYSNPTNNFDGYKAYEISIDNGITEKYNITHAQDQEFFYCYSRSTLSERSFVFDGNVMTLKRHSVRITDLGTGAPVNNFSFVEKTDVCSGCYGTWLY